MLFRCRSIIVGFSLFFPSVATAAQVEMKERNLPLEGPARQVAIASETKQIFVLTEAGDILIYSEEGAKISSFAAGDGINSMAVAPEGNRVFLSRAGKPTLSIVDLSFIQQIDLTGAPIRGNPDAPVTIVVFSEFQCPYCDKVRPLIEQALADYPDEVRVAFKHYPLQRHPLAVPAAMASVAAQEQGLFWEVHDLIFNQQQSLSADRIRELAVGAGLDMTLYEASLRDPGTAARVAGDQADGVAAGVRGTPTIFVNGQRLKNRSPAALRAMIDDELGRRGSR